MYLLNITETFILAGDKNIIFSSNLLSNDVSGVSLLMMLQKW